MSDECTRTGRGFESAPFTPNALTSPVVYMQLAASIKGIDYEDECGL